MYGMTVPAGRTLGSFEASGARHVPAPGRQRKAALVLVVLVIIVVPASWRTWVRLHGVYDGVQTSPGTAPGWSEGVTVAKVEGPAKGLVRPGDRVVAVDGVPLTDWVVRHPITDRAAGERVRYSILRRGERLEVDVVLRQLNIQDVLDAEASTAPLLLCVVGVAGLVFVRRPRDHAARALLLVAALIAAGAAVSPFLLVIDLAGGRGVWPFVSDRIARALMWGALLHFTLVFPERAPALRRRAWLLGLAYLGPFLLYGLYLAATLPGATTQLERLGRFVSVSRLASYVYPLVVVGTMALRYWRLPPGGPRQRLKWVLVTFAVSVALFLALGEIPGGKEAVVRADLLPLVFLPCPLAIGAAILRYRLFDVEIILKRSLVYGGLTLGVLSLYFVSVEVLERLFGGDRGLPLLVSGLVAACVPGLRRWLQVRVGRLIYGERDDPEEVMARLGQRLEATVDPQAVLPAVVETLAQTLRLSYAALDVRSGDGEILARAVYGGTDGQVLHLPLVQHGERVGELHLAVRPGAEPFGPADQRLLEHISRQAAAAAHGVALFAALQRSLERVVIAREEERRRLRRDLHDGLGPTLAATALQLRVARSLVGKDPPSAEALMDRLAMHVQTATADVRRIVDDLRPADLDQLGLVGAIQQRAAYFGRQGNGTAQAGVLDVTIETDGPIEALPAAVEVAAFSIVIEALNNASRHGGATACTVELRVGDVLGLRVRDNGSGLPETVVQGVGTASMCERAAELGGMCRISRAEEGGTVVEAVVPLHAGGRVDGSASRSGR